MVIAVKAGVPLYNIVLAILDLLYSAIEDIRNLAFRTPKALTKYVYLIGVGKAFKNKIKGLFGV